MDLQLSESIRGRLEDFLEAECLVGDNCISEHKKKKKKKEVQKYKNITQT